jgi:lysophospholipase L1-like esterase
MLMGAFGVLINPSNSDSTNILQKAHSQAVVDRPTIISSYGSDDGVADAQIQGDYSLRKGMFKSFPSVVIPTSADMIIKIAISHVNPEILFCMNVTIGNVDSEYNFTGAAIQEPALRFRGTASDYYLMARINDIETKGLSNGRVGLNCSAAYEADFTVGVDLRAEASGYQSWHYAPTTWTNYTGSWRIMSRIEFVEKEMEDSDKTLTQIQMGSSVSTSGNYWANNTRYNLLNPENAVDGLTQVTTTGYGWACNNKTTGSWINLTFKDKAIISIGDSIMCGAPYHNPIPSLYGVNDYYYKSMQWRLGQLLGQPIANRGISAQTTTQMLARYDVDVLNYNPDFVLIMGGINDIGTYMTPATTIETNLQAMIDGARTHGAKVVLYTVLPDSNINATCETIRVALNNWINSSAASDVYVIDAASDMADPTDMSALLPLYDSGDHVHPSMAGYWRMANLTFASAPFNSVASVVTSYLIDSIVLEVDGAGISNPARPMSINISFSDGYYVTSLANTTSQTIDIGKVSTSWLKVTLSAYHKVTTAAPAFFMLGEIRVFGLATTWQKNAIYNMGGFQSIGLLTDQYGKLPYPRSTASTMSSSPSVSSVNITMEAWGISSARWTANTTVGAVTFTLSGLESGRMYRLYIDGVSSNLLTASGSGVISFTYSGPWSEHQFEIVATSISGSISPLVNLIFIMFAIGVVVGVIAEGTYSIRKNKMLSTPEMMRMLFNMLIYIVIGITGIGVLYSIVV